MLGEGVTVLRGLTEKVTFEQRLEDGEGFIHVEIGDMHIPGGERGPGAFQEQ